MEGTDKHTSKKERIVISRHSPQFLGLCKKKEKCSPNHLANEMFITWNPTFLTFKINIFFYTFNVLTVTFSLNILKMFILKTENIDFLCFLFYLLILPGLYCNVLLGWVERSTCWGLFGPDSWGQFGDQLIQLSLVFWPCSLLNLSTLRLKYYQNLTGYHTPSFHNVCTQTLNLRFKFTNY